MRPEFRGQEAPTRREYVKYGGAVLGSGLLAGCSSNSDAQELYPDEFAGEELFDRGHVADTVTGAF